MNTPEPIPAQPAVPVGDEIPVQGWAVLLLSAYLLAFTALASVAAYYSWPTWDARPAPGLVSSQTPDAPLSSGPAAQASQAQSAQRQAARGAAPDATGAGQPNAPAAALVTQDNATPAPSVAEVAIQAALAAATQAAQSARDAVIAQNTESSAERARQAEEARAKAKESEENEKKLVRFVLYLGILGACIHAMTSMATYVGNKTFLPSWTVWYVLRPFIGGALAWLIFLVFRGGFLGGASINAVNGHAFGALGALSGLFSKRVTDKLSELVDTVFRMPPGQGDEARANKAVLAAVTISSVAPAQVSAAATSTTLTIAGKGFVANSVVEVGSTSLTPSEINPTELKVEVPAAAVAGRAAVDVVVRAGSSKGAPSNAFSLKVTA
jgi:hypothetical protein